MPDLSAIQARLQRLAEQANHPSTVSIITLLRSQHYRAQLNAAQVNELCEKFGLSPVALALSCVDIAACYAFVPVSGFYVGAVAIGQSGTFYFGANQEFSATAIQQTVHAEQSAIAHAWQAGEAALTDIAVNTTPCGHCRQFMNELNSAAQLNIHLPHRRYNSLQDYLPDSFGPKDLRIERLLFDTQPRHFDIPHDQGDVLIHAALSAAKQAYAPYSGAFSAVSLQLNDGQIICGRYAENAAFNPSLPPLQTALNYRRLSGLGDVNIERIVMAEKRAVLSQLAMTEDLAKKLLGIDKIEYIAL